MGKELSDINTKALIKTLKKYKPKKVLELGTGSGKSTEQLAKYCEKVVTLEQEQRFVDLAKQNIPVALQSKIDFRLSPAYIFQLERFKYFHFVGYKNLPIEEFDLVFIDGPASTEKGIILPAGDLFKLNSSLIFVDGRKFSVAFYKKFMKLKIIKEKHYTLFQYTKK